MKKIIIITLIIIMIAVLIISNINTVEKYVIIDNYNVLEALKTDNIENIQNELGFLDYSELNFEQDYEEIVLENIYDYDEIYNVTLKVWYALLYKDSGKKLEQLKKEINSIKINYDFTNNYILVEDNTKRNTESYLGRDVVLLININSKQIVSVWAW